jgi:hypothetical protein
MVGQQVEGQGGLDPVNPKTRLAEIVAAAAAAAV